MKNLILTAAIAVFVSMTACVGGKKTSDQTADSTQTTANVQVNAYDLDGLLKVADQMVDKTVTVTGHITHTCKHSGKRCFIAGADPKASMRIEAGGEIGGFNRELVGSEIAVTGVLKERRLTQEYIAQSEKELAKKQMEDGNVESCKAEMANIEEMKAWMKANGKDYYSIYYLDGENYEVVE